MYIKDGLKIESKNLMKLPSAKVDNLKLEGKFGTIAGYGYVNDDKDLVDYLKYAILPVVNGIECAIYMDDNRHKYIEEKNICIGTNVHASTCK